MSKRIICEVCQTEYNSDLDACPVCDTPKPEQRSVEKAASNPAWKKGAVAALAILFVLFAAFIAYEFLFGSAQSDQQTPCTGLYLTESEVELLTPEQFQYLTVHATPADTTDEIVFQSMDTSVATVNEEGKVEAVAEGRTQIIVTCGNYTTQCEVICSFSGAK